MRTVIILLILGGLAGGAAYYLRSRPDQPAAAPETFPVQVARASLIQSVASTGRVVSNLDVDIKCKASGQVMKLPFDISDPVKKGELLVELDPVDEQRAVDLATVSLSESQAKLAQARQNVVVAEKTLAVAQDRFETTLRSAEIRAQELRARAERRKELLEKNLGTQEEYDAARTLAVQAEAELQSVRLQAEELKTQDLALEVKRQDVKLAEADVASDQIALANAKRRLEETKVSAPMDGVVSARTVQIGQIISSGITNVGGGTTILTLSDLSRVFVLAAVDESDIGQVTLDQPANISVDAFPGVRFRGKVVRIATKGVNLSNVVTFEVKIEVLSPNKTLLKPEMTANVQVVAAQKDDVLVVPMQAISRKDEKLMATVSRPDGSTEDRPVEVGMTDGTNWEIVAGLSEGETVLAKKGEAESRWRAGGPRPMGGPFMMGGHGGGGGRSR